VKEHLVQSVATAPLNERRHRAREYLQHYLLRLLQEAGLTARLSFVGGTALRMLFGLPRFSEDLDFSLPDAAPGRAGPGAELAALVRPLEAAGYTVTARLKETGAVQCVTYRFPGLLRDAGATPDGRVVLAIKVEVDTQPPEGAVTASALVPHLFPATVVHADLPSLFAEKVHALLARPWVKGRDWYDLFWFLTEKRGVAPNQEMLRNALRQTGHAPALAADWRGAVRSRLGEVDWRQVRADVEPLLERASDLELLTVGRIGELLSGEQR